MTVITIINHSLKSPSGAFEISGCNAQGIANNH